MCRYQNLWDGEVINFCEPSDAPSNNLDNIEIGLDSPFKTICRPYSDEGLKKILTPTTLVLATEGHQHLSVSAVCRAAGAKCIYVTEYSLATRLQIVREYQKTPLHGLWSGRWHRKLEKRQVKAIRLADGVQCNGTPTYDAYKHLTASSLLFFDTRSEPEMIPNEPRLKGAQPLIRLVFSGRSI